MKKTVIIILAILPIVLLATIGFAGRILDGSKKPRVVKVEFAEYYFGTPYDDDYIYELAMGTEKQTRIVITFDQEDDKGKGDKAVVYESSNENICTVDKDGKIYGVNPGFATIKVTTHDQDKTDYLDILVKAQVTGITLNTATLEMSVGETQILHPTVNLPEAPQEDKKVNYESDDESVVKVTQSGVLTAKKAGVAIITASVTTTKGQYFEAKCTITVVEGTPPISFDFDKVSWINKQGEFYVSSQNVINLNDFVTCDDKKVEKEDIKFKIQFGSSNGILSDGILTLNNNKPTTIRAYVGNEQSPTYYVEVIIEYEQP